MSWMSFKISADELLFKTAMSLGNIKYMENASFVYGKRIVCARTCIILAIL